MIVIDENYSISHDPNCFTLKYHKKQFCELKQKEVNSSNYWYVPNVKQALKEYINQSLKIDGDVADLLKKIQELEAKIDNINI